MTRLQTTTSRRSRHDARHGGHGHDGLSQRHDARGRRGHDDGRAHRITKRRRRRRAGGSGCARVRRLSTTARPQDRRSETPSRRASAVDNGVMNAQTSVIAEDVTFPTIDPDTCARAAQWRTRQCCLGLLRADNRHRHHRRGRRRDCRGLSGKRDDVRQAVYRSRQMDRGADAAVGSRRYLRRRRQEKKTAGQS